MRGAPPLSTLALARPPRCGLLKIAGLDLPFAPFSSPSAWTPFSASSTTSMQTPANSYHVIVFPADGRAPHLADMPVTHDFYAYGLYNPAPPALAHPEVHMEYIAEGAHAHRFIRVDALEGMTGKLGRPYAVFYPVLARDGMPFAANKCVREIQAGRVLPGAPWRGDLVVAAYSDASYATLVPAKMSDFPIIKNYFMTNMAPPTQTQTQ